VTESTTSNVPAEHHPGSELATGPVDHFPAAEWVLKDIDRSVDYRKKFYEYSITIATALLAFSISFPPTLTAVEFVFLVRIAWVALGFSILSGVVIHFAWSKFFISFRDFDNRRHREKGQLNRKKWTSLRRTMELVQFITLLIGVMGMSIFAGVNYQHLAQHSNDSNPAAKVPSPQR
jgi:integral membrane sensor domain MASE1